MITALFAFFAAITGFIGNLLLPTDTYAPPPLTYTAPITHDISTPSQSSFEYKNLNNATHWFGTDGLADTIAGEPCRVRATSHSGKTVYLALNLGDTTTLPLPDCVHAPQFTLLNSTYAVDGERMYYLFPYLKIPSTQPEDESLYVKARLIAGSSADRARALSEDLGADSTHVYERGKKLEGIDGSSFTLLGDTDENSQSWRPFAKDAKNAYFIQGSDMEKIDGADAQTFVPLGREYAKDATSVYIRAERIPGVDPRTVEVLAYPPSCGRSACSPSIPFLKDANEVYYYSDDTEKFIPVIGADPKTFSMLDAYVSKDVRALYLHGRAVPEVDILSLRIVTTHSTSSLPVEKSSFKLSTYLKDNAHVYYYSSVSQYGHNPFLKVVPLADPKTFHLIDSGRGKDAQHVYVGTEVCTAEWCNK